MGYELRRHLVRTDRTVEYDPNKRRASYDIPDILNVKARARADPEIILSNMGRSQSGHVQKVKSHSVLEFGVLGDLVGEGNASSIPMLIVDSLNWNWILSRVYKCHRV